MQYGTQYNIMEQSYNIKLYIYNGGVDGEPLQMQLSMVEDVLLTEHPKFISGGEGRDLAEILKNYGQIWCWPPAGNLVLSKHVGLQYAHGLQLLVLQAIVGQP